MSKQLKPMIRYKYAGLEFLYDCPTAKGLGKGKPYLCHPLIKASRKAMVEAMAKGMCSIYPGPEEYYNKTKEAEAALAALEKMAGEK